MTTNGTSNMAASGALDYKELRHQVRDNVSALKQSHVDAIGKYTQIRRNDFETRHLVVQTIREPFNHWIYRYISAQTIRRLNLAVSILQCIFIAGPAFIYLAFPVGNDTNCIYAAPEQIPVSIFKSKNDDTSTGSVTHMVFDDTRDHFQKMPDSRQVAFTVLDAHRGWNVTRGRGKEICSLIQSSTLARREDTTRDYLGPVVDWAFSTDAQPVCGYWRGPDRHYQYSDSEQKYWWDAFHQVRDGGFHYGKYPQLHRERPVAFEHMDTEADSAKFIHVCVMPPIQVSVFGIEGALPILIGSLVTAFCGLYILGPPNHSDTLFSLSYVGTVNIAGVVTMMISYLVNIFAVWLLERIFRYKYRREIQRALDEDEQYRSGDTAPLIAGKGAHGLSTLS